MSQDARHRLVAQPAAGVDALAEARDLGVALELRRARRSVDVGDEQPRGVRPDVDDGDAHGRPQPAGNGTGSPASPASRLRTARSVIAARAPFVAEPMCGTTSRLGARSSGSSAGSGSGTVTSSAAPPMLALVQRLRRARRGR